MIIDMEPRELSPDVSALIFSGRFVLGNRLKDVEHSIQQRIQHGLKKLVLDFTGVNFIDSSGIGVLAYCIGSMEQAGGKLVMVCPPGQVRQLIKLTHLDQVVGIYSDLTSAQTALAGPATPPPA